MNKVKTPKLGIYSDVPFAEYEKWDAVNNSVLWKLKTHSPLHAKEFMDNPPEPTAAMKTGKAFHTLLLEPRKFNRFYAIMPECDRRTKQGKEIYHVFVESSNNKEILTQADYNQIDIMADAIKKQVIYRYIQKGEAEVCIVWREQKTGLLCKARIDYVHREEAIFIDVKSTIDASPYSFAKSIYNYGYYQQAAFYCDGWKTLTNDEPIFVFLPAEKNPPYAVAAYEAHEQIIFAGRNSYQQAIDKFEECQKTGNWPGYEEKVQILNLPDWALYAEGLSRTARHQIFE